LRTLRHPGVVKVFDTVETDTYIYIATERIVPLSWHVKRQALNTETIKWGLYSVASTLKFINDEATSIHGNIRVSSVFTIESGEWKLAGFDVLSSVKEEDPVIYTYGGLVIDSSRYAAPEVVKGGWEVLRNQSIYVTDSWNFGTLIYEIFNGSFTNGEQLSQPKAIPPNMVHLYKRLVNPNPKMRVSIAHFLEQARRSKGVLDTPLIRCSEFVENMGVKNDREREEFLKNLEDTKDEFPEEFFKMKILPELIKSVEFGGGGPKVFAVVLMIAEKLTDEEWENNITPWIVRLFNSPDRAIRIFLLENLPKMVDHLPQNIVSNSIFPQLVSGFSDAAPIIREQTVKAILVIIGKLSDRQINGDLLKYLAKTQNDDQPGIRTNTTICLGKIARNLGQHTRSKVLVAAFTRSLRDPFVHARNAALLALAATADVFDENDCAARCLPAICVSLIDKEKIIRVQASKTLEVFLQRVKSLTSSMPDSILPPPTEQGNTNIPRMGTTQQDESWAGWAISSFTKKLNVSGQIESLTTPKTSVPGTPSSEVVPDSTTATSAPTTSYQDNRHNESYEESNSFAPSAGIPDEDENEDADPWGDMDDTPAPKLSFGRASGSKALNSLTNNNRPVLDRMSTEDEIIASFSEKPKPSLPKGLARKTPLTNSSTIKSATTSVSKPAASTIGKTNVIVSAKKPIAATATKKTSGPTTTVSASKTKPLTKGVANKPKIDEWGNEDTWDDDWK